MTNRVLIKRSNTPNAVPASGDLEYGELALNYNDGNLFFKDAANTITTLASTQSVTVSGNITGSYILANGSQLTGINSFSTVQVAGQGNVAASGLESVLVFDGDGIAITTDPANNTVLFSSSGAAIRSALYGVGGSMGNLTDPLVSSGDAGLITDNATAIQDLGIITEAAAVEYAIDTAGNINAGNVVAVSTVAAGNVVATGKVTATGNVSGNYLLGNIFFASGYSASKIYNGTTEVNIATPNGNLEVAVAGTPNVLVVSSSGANISGYTTVTGNVTGGNILTSGAITASGNITGSNLSGTLVSGTLTTASQPNVTSVGTLSALAVSGTTTITGAINQTGNLNITGNINVTGNLNYENVTDLVVGDPLIFIGANNSANLFDLGFVASWDDGVFQHGGLVRDHTDGIWKVFGNVVAQPTTTIDWANAVYEPLRSGAFYATTGTFSGNVSVGNLSTDVLTANTVSGTLSTAAQPNVTSLGTLVSLDVTGNVTGGNISTTGVVTAAGNITSGNIITAGDVSTSTVTASGNINAGNVVLSGSAEIQGDLNVDADITFVGNLNSLGNASFSGNVAASYILANGSQLTGVNAFSTIAVSTQSNIVADSISDTLTLVAGAGISIGTDAATDTITFTSTPEIWAVGGSMGLVTQSPTVFYDFSTVDDAVTIAYDLGGLVVSGIVTTDSIVDGAVTGVKLAPNIDITTTGNVVAAVIKTTPVTVSALPAAATAGVGARAFVTDADAMVFGNLAVGGSGNAVPVYSDGSNWRIG